MREREKTVSERIEECKRMRHWGDVERLHGEPVADVFGQVFAKVNNFEDYSINSKISGRLMNVMQVPVFPCKRNRKSKREVLEHEQRIAIGLRANVDQIMPVIINGNKNRGPIGGFIRNVDLFRTPEDLKKLDREGEVEERAIELAYEILTGEEFPQQEE